MADYRLYDLTLTVLTPLHIGSGRELLNHFDYAVHKGCTWRLNEDALLEAQNVDDPRLADQLASTAPANLLQPSDFRTESAFFRYVIRGTPRSSAPGAILREQIKDVYDRPYLPGTTLKGALRTVLAWTAWPLLKLRPERTRLGRDRRFAAQWYEQELFSEHSGKAPNKDTLRALHISDSAPVAPDNIMLVNARVMNRRGGLGSPIELEALRPGTKLQARLKVDTALFSEWARQQGLKLRWDDLLARLPEVVRAFSARRLAQERALYASISQAGPLARFYQTWQEEALPTNAFLLQLGWGTGWEGKTLGSHLQADERFMEVLLQDYHLARGRREVGDPFPKSRRVLVKVEKSGAGQAIETPLVPLGWVLVEMMEVNS
jgi:CRISPR-associated protein Csm5